MRDDNFESECEGICGCPYIETRAANHPGAEQTKQTGSAVPVNTAKALALAAMGA
jgi:hypothetical protein